MDLNLKSFYHKTSGTFTYLLISGDLGVGGAKAIIIDPVLDFDLISASTSINNETLDYLKEHEVSLEAVLETHAHADHLSAAFAIKEKYGAVYAVSERIRTVQASVKALWDVPDDIFEGEFDMLLPDGLQQISSFKFEVISLPGHTPDSVGFLFETVNGNWLFCGDSMFSPTEGGSAEVLANSMQRILDLPEETKIFFCHSYLERPVRDCTVAEAHENIHWKQGRDAFIKWRTERDTNLELPRLFICAVLFNANGARGLKINETRQLLLPLNQKWV